MDVRRYIAAVLHFIPPLNTALILYDSGVFYEILSNALS